MDFQRNWIKSVQLDGAGGVGLIEDFLPGTVFSNPIENGSVDSTVSNPSFSYSAAGNYTARLTVTKSTGNNRPVVTISDPPEGGLFEWGEDVHFTVGATDTEDGSTPTDIACASLATLPALGHDEHKHDDLPIAGCQGDVSIAANTEGDTDNLFYILNSSYTELPQAMAALQAPPRNSC